jgi:hypothetical protein
MDIDGLQADAAQAHPVAAPKKIEGRIEILSTEFAVGWASASASGQFTHLIAVLDGEVIGASSARLTRPDLDRQRSEGRLNAYAFVIVFDRPVAAERVESIAVLSAFGQHRLRRAKALRIDRSPPLKIFLLGSPRSGTSEMGNTLTSVLKLPWLGEVHAAPLFAAAGLSMRGDAKSPLGMLRFLNAHDIGSVAITALKQVYFYMHASASFVDKTPGVRMVETLPFIRECFPDARFVFLSRNPVANVLSRLAKFGGRFEDHCYDWAASMTAWMQIRARLPHYLEVRQEDMMEQPAAVGEAIATYLGVAHAAESIGASLSAGSMERTGAGLGKSTPAETGWTAEQAAFFARICTPVYEAFVSRQAGSPNS